MPRDIVSITDDVTNNQPSCVQSVLVGSQLLDL